MGFFGALEWILILALVICIIVFVFTPSSKSAPVANTAIGLFAVLWIWSTASELKAGKTNWFLIIGGIISVAFGFLTFKSYNKLEDMRNDRASRIEDAAVEMVNDKISLGLESDIDKQEKKFKNNLYIAIAGLALYCVGHIVKSNKEKNTVIVERTVQVQPPVQSNPAPAARNTGKDHKFCQNCGAKLTMTAKFCNYCGAKSII